MTPDEATRFALASPYEHVLALVGRCGWDVWSGQVSEAEPEGLLFDHMFHLQNAAPQPIPCACILATQSADRGAVQLLKGIATPTLRAVRAKRGCAMPLWPSWSIFDYSRRPQRTSAVIPVSAHSLVVTEKLPGILRRLYRLDHRARDATAVKELLASLDGHSYMLPGESAVQNEGNIAQVRFCLPGFGPVLRRTNRLGRTDDYHPWRRGTLTIRSVVERELGDFALAAPEVLVAWLDEGRRRYHFRAMASEARCAFGVTAFDAQLAEDDAVYFDERPPGKRRFLGGLLDWPPKPLFEEGWLVGE